MLGSGPDAVALREDAMGVALEDTPRNIQANSHNGGYTVSLNKGWLNQLELAEQSAATLHSFSSGTKPVIVQNPAIIVQPAAVLEVDDE